MKHRQDLYHLVGAIHSLNDLQKFTNKQPQGFYYNYTDRQFSKIFFEHSEDSIPLNLVSILNAPIYPRIERPEAKFYSKKESPTLALLAEKFKTIAQTEHIECLKCKSSIPLVRHKARYKSTGLLASHISSYQPKELTQCSCGLLKVFVDSIGRPNVISDDLINVSLKYNIWFPFRNADGGFIERTHNLGGQPVINVPLYDKPREDLEVSEAECSTDTFTKNPTKINLLDGPRGNISYRRHNDFKFNQTKLITTHGIPSYLESLVFPKFSYNPSSLLLEPLKVEPLENYNSLEVYGTSSIGRNYKLPLVTRSYSRHLYALEYAMGYKVMVSTSKGLYLPSGIFINCNSEFYKSKINVLYKGESRAIPRHLEETLIALLDEYKIPIYPVRTVSLLNLTYHNASTLPECYDRAKSTFSDHPGYPMVSIGFLPLYSIINSRGLRSGIYSKLTQLNPSLHSKYETRNFAVSELESYKRSLLVYQKGSPRLRDPMDYISNLKLQKLLTFYMTQLSSSFHTLVNHNSAEDFLEHTELFKVDFGPEKISKRHAEFPVSNAKRLCLYSLITQRALSLNTRWFVK